jgi:hypothetical protein
MLWATTSTCGYLRRVNEDYGNLKLYQLHTAAADDVMKLRDIFVPQAVREALPPSDVPEGHRERLREREGGSDESEIRSEHRDGRGNDEHDEVGSRYLSLPVRSILEVAADPTSLRVVILGGPGSGKSSLLQFLTLQGVTEPELAIPILIELGKYARDNAESRTILEFLESGDFALFHLNQNALDAALKNGQASLLLDGLDEIFDHQRHEAVIAEVKRLSITYPKARIWVTTRIVGYQSQHLRDASFRHFTLQDFESSQNEDFLNRWHHLTNLPEHDKRSRHARLPILRRCPGSRRTPTPMSIGRCGDQRCKSWR